MPPEIVEHAPAKVNLALHVTGQRSDGYHLLDTLVVFTTAGDLVRVRPADEDSFCVAGPFATALQDETGNLVLRARDLLRRISGAGGAVDIVLEKNLPIASGVGGGSSDAAATLRALRRLWHLPIGDSQLSGAALELGADLPMCLTATTLQARGVGEVLQKVDGLPPLPMVLVNPGVAVPTPSVFRALANRENPPLPAVPHTPHFSAVVSWLEHTRNDLEPAARSVAQEISQTLEALRVKGAAFVRMSGSGATCFGLFASPKAASEAAQAIAAEHPSWYVEATETIQEVPAHVTH